MLCQLLSRDDPQIPMDPLEFMLTPHSMTNVEYNSWRSVIPYAKWLLNGLDYEEFNINCLICLPLLLMYMLNLFFFFSFTLFVMASNGGKLLVGGACCW